MSSRKVSADRAYQVIANKPENKLTREQVAAVENAPIDWPSLVVAGAGSGKTELMSIRVVWLVANAICRPEQILGLTFTRKAASELSRRINNALTLLSKTELWPYEEKDFASPNITTYNSYANTLYRDYALALGYEDDATLLTDASRFQLAREVVIKYGEEIDPRITETDMEISSIVEATLKLAAAMNDHGVSVDEIDTFISDFHNSIASLPAHASSKVTKEQPIGKTLLGSISGALNTPMLARMAQGFLEEKRIRGFIDFSDQVALAERAVRELGDTVKKRETGLYQQILLDEYQDTSTLQTRLLAGIFAGKSVFAVGDPNQSIYGWRGASASNLADFLTTFGTSERSVEQFPLNTSWRNPKVVLDIANHILGPLKLTPGFLADRPPLAKVEVGKLAPASYATDGEVTIKFADQLSTEALFIANWLKENIVPDDKGKLPTAAVLMRSRNMMAEIQEVLRESSLSVEIIGLGGLLETPEIVDLVSALRAIHYPNAGANLMRLLAGPRWQIEPKDLQRLSNYARDLAKFWTKEKVSGAEAESSIIDALDYLLDDEDSDRIPNFSERGLASLKNCAEVLRKLRTQTGMPLPEFVRATHQELWLDIELAANPKREDPMANLNSFANLVTGYAEGAHPTLGGFLEWLEYAENKERFEPPATAAKPGVVQIITAHSAKGLEWDLVVIPRLVEGTFPSTPKTNAWLAAGELPYKLRGDANSLPMLSLNGCANQTDVGKRIEAFKKGDQTEYLLLEERRIAYVAVTRPKKKLLLTGSKWKPGSKGPNKPSQFLVEIAKIQDPRIDVIDRGLDEAQPLPEYPELTVNPADLSQLKVTWPMEPLGPKHRPILEKASTQVSEAMANRKPQTFAIDDELEMLFAEREELISRVNQVKLPVRISSSSFKDFVNDLPKVAKKYLRPLPEPPYKQTMAGTLFHSWVEQRFGVLSASDDLDSLESLDEDEATRKTIEELREIFEASRFSKMKPHSIEGEIQVTILGNTFIGKLDAVFETETGFEIVDWKTGIPPKTEKEIAERSLQLALYRMAFSRLYGVDPSRIEVCLYYVADDLEIKPEKIPSESELIEMWNSVLEKVVD